jgi:diguanylate cyclase (GGDEF)-like protein
VDIACRFGGEEFALVVPELGRNDGSRVPIGERALADAEAFRAAVAGTRASGVGVTVSIGVAIGPRDGESPDALIDAADRMLALAVAAGGNTVRATWIADANPDDE